MGVLGTPLGWIMKIIFDFIPSYAIALILFTLLIKLVLFPLAVSQQKNSAKMAIMKPKLEKLQKQYGNDKQKHQEAMMKLYEEEGYNPMSSCLPMLVQMLLLFGVIDVVYKPLKHLLSIPTDLIKEATTILTDAGVKVASAELSIINIIQGNEVVNKAGEVVSPDLFNNIFSADVIEQISNFDLYFLGLNLGVIPYLAFPILLIPILSGLTSLGVTIFSLKQQASNGMDQQMKGMKVMMYIMPLFSVYFAFQLAAGVGIYWIISNLFSFIQSVILYKIYSPEKMKVKVAAEIEARKKKKKSRYQLALQEARRRQAEANGETLSDDEIQKDVDAQIKQKESMTPSQKIALARQRQAEKYGDVD